jgi:Transposase DDE domain group 1
VKDTIPDQLAARQREIEDRLDPTRLGDCSRPVMTAGNIHYEISERVHGIANGGIGAFHLLARRIGLIDAIDRKLHLLTIHLPYHESDHVLNLAYIPLCNGTCLQDIELRRHDVHFLDALGARRIPDPTTAGDFCRRFGERDIDALQDVYDEIRVGVWGRQPDAFFAEAVLDADGTLVATGAEHKEGVDIAYDGTWGYHPLLVSLANTGEVMRIVNRPGNRPSHEGAAGALDRAAATCLAGGFRRVLLRGDTDFSQTEHLDRWNADGRIRFIFGYDARSNLIDLAERLPETAWEPLRRRQPPPPATGPRRPRPDVKDERVRARAFETLRLRSEDVAEFNYRPSVCREEYRMVVVRKNISREKGDQCLFDEIRYFFYITNEWVEEAEDVVLAPRGANGRCHQENLIQQLQMGVHAFRTPVDTLLSNWAYMVMTSLAWNLKAWAALMLPETGAEAKKCRAEKTWLQGIEFKAFVNALVAIPCQIVRQARCVIYRVMGYNPYQPIFFRLLDVLRC